MGSISNVVVVLGSVPPVRAPVTVRPVRPVRPVGTVPHPAGPTAGPAEIPKQTPSAEQTPASKQTRRTGTVPAAAAVLPSVIRRRRRAGVEKPALAPAAPATAEQPPAAARRRSSILPSKVFIIRSSDIPTGGPRLPNV